MAIDMEYAINLNAILAVRAEDNYCSEMTTQMLFGEYCRIIEEKNSFYFVENLLDKHTGWVAQNGLTKLSKEDLLNLQSQPEIRVSTPMAEVFNLTNKTILRLPLGSLIPNYNADSSSFEIADLRLQIHPSFISYLPGANKDGIVPTALALQNTPYLNGGKTIFGMDCSGLAQVVFSINGYTLPRFSAQQAASGETIETTDQAVAGDLFFYTKKDVPSHTAIYLGNGKIIHAAECVKAEDVDSLTGNMLDEHGETKYELYRIKRIG